MTGPGPPSLVIWITNQPGPSDTTSSIVTVPPLASWSLTFTAGAMASAISSVGSSVGTGTALGSAVGVAQPAAIKASAPPNKLIFMVFISPP